MGVPDISVGSVSELLTATRAAEAALGGGVLWARGHADAAWALTPHAHRKHPILERETANRFRQRAPTYFRDCPEWTDYPAWLAMMQHHGVPTRLLDWTESLAIAAWFAVDEAGDRDRAIWLLNPGALNRAETFGAIPFMTHERVRPLVECAFRQDQQALGVLATYPRYGDPRMAAQLSAFTVHGERSPLDEHPNAARFLRKLVVPKASVATVREELVMLGTRRTTVFPDIGNLARELRDLVAIVDEDPSAG